jgi:hypothetical protein
MRRTLGDEIHGNENSASDTSRTRQTFGKDEDWHNRVGGMLAYVNDVLVPRGFENTLKEYFK